MFHFLVSHLQSFFMFLQYLSGFRTKEHRQPTAPLEQPTNPENGTDSREDQSTESQSPSIRDSAQEVEEDCDLTPDGTEQNDGDLRSDGPESPLDCPNDHPATESRDQDGEDDPEQLAGNISQIPVEQGVDREDPEHDCTTPVVPSLRESHDNSDNARSKSPAQSPPRCASRSFPQGQLDTIYEETQSEIDDDQPGEESTVDIPDLESATQLDWAANSLNDPGLDDEGTESIGLQRCHWNRFSRPMTRKLMPPNIPHSKVPDGEGGEKECPLVPELKLTTPEGEDVWLDDLTYYPISGGWADSDDDDEEL